MGHIQELVLCLIINLFLMLKEKDSLPFLGLGLNYTGLKIFERNIELFYNNRKQGKSYSHLKKNLHIVLSMITFLICFQRN